MKNITDTDLQTMDYIDSLILTMDNHKLNETIKSIYYTLILEDYKGDISDYLRIKAEYIQHQENMRQFNQELYKAYHEK